MAGDFVNAAELLRRAASLMRERAEAATLAPWVPSALHLDAIIAPKRVGAFGQDVIDWYGGPPLGESMEPADVEYVASMHPTVALAVARAYLGES